MRICLAASGGGHVRQLLDLKPVWSEHDVVFVTEPTALGETLALECPTHFVTHVAVGQAKLGRPFEMLRCAWRNFRESYRVIRKERPEVVISTGAGAVFSTLFWARLHGAKLIVIESFARFDRPSLFMRIAAPLAHRSIVQSAKLAARFPRALVFDPLRMLDVPRPPKKALMFVTVGATLPFDRMIRSVAELKASGEIPERVIAQVGTGGTNAAGLETVETLSFDEIQALLRDADIVVSHGGTGSLITALRERCRTVVMPRLFELGEHYDNHQLEISESFEKRGLVHVARDLDGLRDALSAARRTDPPGATTDPRALMAWLRQTLSDWQASSRKTEARFV